MKYFKSVLLWTAMAFMLVNCQQPSQSEQDAKRKELANLEAEEQAKEQTKAEQQAKNEQSLKLEKDLQRRYRFYAAVSNEYTGQIKINGTEYGISHKSLPTIPLYIDERIRTLEEVQADLNDLGLDSSIRFWNVKNPQAATGCQFSDIKAFYANGAYKLQSENCGNIFNVFLSDRILTAKEIAAIQSQAVVANALAISKSILAGQTDQATSLIVQMQSTATGVTQSFQLQLKQ
ncbi:MAG: hypothetical protein ACK5WZ_14395 [Pseudobdellovibrionaceae bacterium]